MPSSFSRSRTDTQTITLDQGLGKVTVNVNNVTKGVAPLDVSFKDDSPGNPTSWLWTFGDNTQPVTARNTTHQYKAPGRYLVTLKATGPGGDHISSPTEIAVFQKVQASFQAQPQSGLDPLSVRFTKDRSFLGVLS